MNKHMTFAAETKKIMQERGKRRGHRKCPFCDDGRVTFVLAGNKDHIHGACSTKNCFFMME